MATKSRKRKKSKKKSKSLVIITVLLALAGLVYYLWQQKIIEVPEQITAVLNPAPETPVTPAAPVRDESGFPTRSSSDSILVYSFNIQIFGDSKMRKPGVVSALVDIVSHTDVTAVQEVRASTEAPVQAFMDKLDAKYAYVLGPREGRTASKEQYWVIYDSTKLMVKGSATYDDSRDRFQRSPLAVYFQTMNAFDFILINNHIQPSDAAAEIGVLPEVIAYFQDMWNETDVLIVGDFNADGSYYNENKLIAVFPDADYRIILTNEWDTTVAGDGDSTTYDRFIITKSAIEDYTGNFGVIYFDKLYDFAALGIEPKHISDHFPIWAEFWTTKDTD